MFAAQCLIIIADARELRRLLMRKVVVEKAEPEPEDQRRPAEQLARQMMIYGRPIKNPRLFVVGMLLAAGLLLPVLGSIP